MGRPMTWIHRLVSLLILLLPLAVACQEEEKAAPEPSSGTAPAFSASPMPSAPTTVAAVAVPSTPQPTAAEAGGIAPDQFAYIDNDGDIWLSSADGKARKKVGGKGRCSDVRIAWSPTGDRLAYTGLCDGKPYGVVVDVEGRVLKELMSAIHMVWSPTGRHLLYRAGDVLHIADSEGNVIATLKDPPGPVWVVWAPDGSAVAYTAGGEAVIYDVTGQRRSRGPAIDAVLAWVMEGQALLVATRARDFFGFYEANLLDIESGAMTRVPHLDNDANLWLSPDGRTAVVKTGPAEGPGGGSRLGVLEFATLRVTPIAGARIGYPSERTPDHHVRFSQDGSQIYWADNPGRLTIYRAQKDGTGLTRVASPPGVVAVRFSPNLARIAYFEAWSVLWTSGVDGTHPWRIGPISQGPMDNPFAWRPSPIAPRSNQTAPAALTPTARTSAPTSTPDPAPFKVGTWVEVSSTGACVELRALPQLTWGSGGQQLVPVTVCQPDGFVAYIAAGPEGQHGQRWWGLAGQGWVREEFLRFHHEGDFPWPLRPELRAAGQITYVGPDGNLWLMNGDGSDQQLLARSGPGERVTVFRWSPDGSRLAYAAQFTPPPTSFAQGRSTLHIIDRSGRALLEVPGAGLPSWSPTGDLLAYFHPPPGQQAPRLQIADVSGRTLHELPEAIAFVWSPDGRRVSYLTKVAEGGLWPEVTASILDVKSGNLWELDSVPSTQAFRNGPPLFSPDGRWVAYGSRLFRASTRQEERSLPGPVAKWSPDGRALLAIRASPHSFYDPSSDRLIQQLDIAWGGHDAPPWASPELRSLVWMPAPSRLAYFDWGEFTPQRRPNALRLEQADGSILTVPMWVTQALDPSPNGRHLTFFTNLQVPGNVGSTWIWAVDADGSNLTLLAEGSQPAWTPSADPVKTFAD